jgi:hypothetical protein
MQKVTLVLLHIGLAVLTTWVTAVPTWAQEAELNAPRPEELGLPEPDATFDSGDPPPPPETPAAEAPLEGLDPPSTTTESSSELPAEQKQVNRRFIDRTREPKPWPGPFLGLRLTASGGAGNNFLESSFVPLLAPYLALEFGYSFRAWGASLHFEGTAATLPLSGQGEPPQHFMMGINGFWVPSLRWRFLFGVDIINFYRMTSSALANAHWWRGFGLRAGMHYRLPNWGENVSPNFVVHVVANRYPLVEVSTTGVASELFVETYSFQAMVGLQIDFQL